MRASASSTLPRLLIGLALLVALLFSLYGIAAPFATGHNGYHGGEYSTRARHTLRHGTVLPGNWVGWKAPERSTYYLHHPILTHHLATLTLFVLGDHEYAVRAAGLLGFFASLALLLLMLHRHSGPWPAALGAWVWVLLPINIYFAPHIDPGYPSIASLLGFFWFYLAWMERGRWRDGALALFCAALAGGFEWSPYLAAMPIGLHVGCVGLWRRGRYLAFALLYVLAVLLPAGGHLLVVLKTGHIPEMKESFTARTREVDLTYYVHQIHRYAKDLFGDVLLWATLIWLGLLGPRLIATTLRRRMPRLAAAWTVRAQDLVVLSFLLALGLYCFRFRVAVLLHPYRLLYGSVVVAVAAADLSRLVAAGTGLVFRGRLAAWICMALLSAGITGSMLRPAWAALLSGRRAGHNYLSPGTTYDPALEWAAFADFVRRSTDPGDVVYAHPSLSVRRDVAYYLDRDLAELKGLVAVPTAKGTRAVAILKYPGLSSSDLDLLKGMAARHPMLLVDRYLLIDLRREERGVRVFRFRAPPPGTWLARYLRGPLQMPELALDPHATAKAAQRLASEGLP